MKRFGIVLVVALVGLVAGRLFGAQQESSSAADSKGAASASRVPRLVRFSGAVEDPSGKSLTGPADLRFAIYKDEADAAPLWQETQTLPVDEQGQYTVLLGAMQGEGLPVELFTSGEARWLGVQVGNLPEQPRVLLVSVPYALRAADAETLGGRPASAYMLAGPSAGTTSSAVLAAVPRAPASTTGTPLQPLTASGATEFNDTTTDQVVKVFQNGSGFGLYALARNSSAIFAQSLATSGMIFGVRGITLSTSGAGVYGQSQATTGAGYGVRGQSGSDAGGGVLGVNTSPTGVTYGVMGITDSAQGAALAARAQATSGTATAVQGITYAPGGTALFAYAPARFGPATGILAQVGSPGGTALVVDNMGGGKLVSAWSNLRETLTVDGSGKLSTRGNLTATGNASFGGNVGVGTSTPTEKLQVIGNIRIRGMAAGNGLIFPDGTKQTVAAGSLMLDTLSLAGVEPAKYARRDTTNTFSGDQTMSGGLENGFPVQGALTVDGLLSGAQFYGNGSMLTVSGDSMVALLTKLERLENVLRPSYPNGAYLWSKAFGGDGRAVAVDANGNVLVTGRFSWDMVDVGCGPPLVWGWHGFVAKYSGVDGSCIWSRTFMTTAPLYNWGVAAGMVMDASGNVLVTGSFRGTVDFGGGPVTSVGPTDIFVAKFSGPDGSLLWWKRFVGTGSPTGIAVDPSGNVLVTGEFEHSMSFGGDALSSAGWTDIFVTKLSGLNGSHLWSKRFGDTNLDLGYGIAVDGSGNVQVTGMFSFWVDTPSGPFPRNDVFVAKLSGADGSLLWSKDGFGGLGAGQGIAVDGTGNVLVTGWFALRNDACSGCWIPSNVFVAKYSGTDGSQLWFKGFLTTTGQTNGRGVAIDASGNVLVTGGITGTVDIGGGPLTTGTGDEPNYDIFVAKYSGVDGSYNWAKTFGSTSEDWGLGVAVDASSNVLVTGRFAGTVDFGGGALTGAIGDDFFLLKLHP